MNNTELKFICDQVEILVAHSITKILYVIKFIICLVGIFLVLWNVVTLGCRWIIHPNAKVMYSFHMVLILLSSFTFGICYAIDTYRVWTSHTYCDAVVSTRLAFYLLTAAVAFDGGLVALFLLMAFERLIASLYPALYESITNARLGFFFVLISISVSVIAAYVLISSPVPWDMPSIAFTLMHDSNKEVYEILVIVSLTIEISSIIVFHFVMIRNRRHLTKRYANALSVNYQKKENRKMSVFLLPVFYLHFVIYLLNAGGFAIYSGYSYNGSPSDFAIFSEYVAWTPLYSLLMPIMLHYFNNTYQKRQHTQSQLHRDSMFIPLDELFTLGKPQPKKPSHKSGSVLPS